MIEIKNNIGNKTIVYAETFEYEAFDQIKKLCNYEPYLNSKIRVMPDAHAGKGCVVGTTMTITDKVTPNLVGVDIGCGMLTVALKEKDIDFKKLDFIINTYVPSGFNVHEKPQKSVDFTSFRCKKVDLQRAVHSVGSLGGGNHFIEIGKSGSSGILYLIIHTGSRKLGGDTCKYYQNLAFQNVNEVGKAKADLIQQLKAAGREKEIDQQLKQFQKQPADKELAYLTGKDFDNYMNDMKFIQEFAKLNRSTIAGIILKQMGLVERCRFETIHNYIDFKRMILRKGAVSAEHGEGFLVPINMRDGSLLCLGKGNPEWNFSAPHGAGRLMSRSSAKMHLDMDNFKDQMEGIYSTSVLPSTLDESPSAYKSIEEIREAITDTADVIDTIKTVYNFKAH